jgi:hypothetical protein
MFDIIKLGEKGKKRKEKKKTPLVRTMSHTK